MRPQSNHKTAVRRRPARRGFSLIEILVVIAIILVLAGIVGVNVLGQRDQATADAVRISMNNIENGLKLFRTNFNRWPTDDEGLAVLWNQEALDPDADETKWAGPYLDSPVPRDEYGNEWFYEAQDPDNESSYLFYSFGPNGEDDAGEEDDITPINAGTEEDDEFGGFSEDFDPPGGV